MLRKVIVGTTAVIVQVEKNGEGRRGRRGTAINAYDTQTGVTSYVIRQDRPTLEVKQAEALAEIGRGERLA